MSEYSAELGKNKKCHVCGKTFFIPAWAIEGYIYRVRLIGRKNYKYYCSYSCYNKIIDEQNIKFKKRYKNG